MDSLPWTKEVRCKGSGHFILKDVKMTNQITDPTRRVVEMSKQRGMTDEDCGDSIQMMNYF